MPARARFVRLENTRFRGPASSNDRQAASNAPRSRRFRQPNTSSTRASFVCPHPIIHRPFPQFSFLPRCYFILHVPQIFYRDVSSVRDIFHLSPRLLTSGRSCAPASFANDSCCLADYLSAYSSSPHMAVDAGRYDEAVRNESSKPSACAKNQPIDTPRTPRIRR